jgi:hypothetical protein
MTAINLTVTRSPLEVGAMLDRLRAAPLGDVLGALGLPAVKLSHLPGRMVAYAGDAPNSAEIEYERVPLVSPFDVSRTAVTITAHDREGRTIAALLTAALSA